MSIVYCGYLFRPRLEYYDLTHTVVLKNCEGDLHAYEEGLKDIWKAETDIVIVEHDMLVTTEQINDLLNCPYIACAHSYYIYPVTTGLKEPVFAHYNRNDDGELVWLDEGEQWSQFAGFGCTKLGRMARREVSSWEQNLKTGWRDLDSRVSRAFNEAGLRFHIHWPTIEHDHR